MCGNEHSLPVQTHPSDFAELLMGRIVGKQLILSSGAEMQTSTKSKWQTLNASRALTASTSNTWI